MDKYDVLNLYEHNAKASNKIKEKFRRCKIWNGINDLMQKKNG